MRGGAARCMGSCCLVLIGVQPDAAVSLHTGTHRDQLTDDNILLQADQIIHLTLDSSFRQYLGGLRFRAAKMRNRKIPSMKKARTGKAESLVMRKRQRSLKQKSRKRTIFW